MLGALEDNVAKLCQKTFYKKNVFQWVYAKSLGTRFQFFFNTAFGRVSSGKVNWPASYLADTVLFLTGSLPKQQNMSAADTAMSVPYRQPIPCRYLARRYRTDCPPPCLPISCRCRHMISRRHKYRYRADIGD